MVKISKDPWDLDTKFWFFQCATSFISNDSLEDQSSLIWKRFINGVSMIFKRVINGLAISRFSSSRWIIMMLGSFSWNWNSYCPAVELGHWIKIGLSENSIPMLTPLHPLVYWQNLGCNPKLLLEINRNHPSLCFSIRYILVNHPLYNYLNYTRLCLKMVLSPRWSLKMIIGEMFCRLYP